MQKLDNDGDFLWVRTIEGDQTNYLEPLTVDDTGSICSRRQLEGTADYDPGPGVFELTSAGSTDMAILKLSSDGHFIWAEKNRRSRC